MTVSMEKAKEVNCTVVGMLPKPKQQTGANEIANSCLNFIKEIELDSRSTDQKINMPTFAPVNNRQYLPELCPTIKSFEKRKDRGESYFAPTP